MVDSTSSYLNTLIFCIVAKAVTVCLLVVLLLESAQKMSYMILTIEIGLICIIAFTLYKVAIFQNTLDDMKASSSKKPAALDTCPDYFVKQVGGTGPISASGTPASGSVGTTDIQCLSKYTTSDKRYIYQFTESSSGSNVGPVDLTSALTTASSACGGTVPKTMDDLCNTVSTSSNASYNNISWTDLKGRCGALDLYTM